MRSLVNLVRLSLVTAVLCCESPVARGQQSAAETLLHDHYPGYHLLRIGERNADTRVFLLRHLKGSDPSVVHADFDGDGQPDYAMLLKSDNSASAKLVVLLCDAPRRCRSGYELDITGYSEGAYLTALPVGSRVAPSASVEGEGHSPPVKLTTVGIQVIYFEKGKGALYWDKKLKKIIEVGTSEQDGCPICQAFFSSAGQWQLSSISNRIPQFETFSKLFHVKHFALARRTRLEGVELLRTFVPRGTFARGREARPFCFAPL